MLTAFSLSLSCSRINKQNLNMVTKKITPPRHHYEKPQMVVVEIVSSSVLLQTSPGQNGQGNLPPTGNNNSDFDW